MYLYTGLRTIAAARIIEPVVCAKVESIIIRERDANLRAHVCVEPELWVGTFLEHILDDEKAQSDVIADPESFGMGKLDAIEERALAHRDGFNSFAAMMTFWDGRLPFYGHIFHWRKWTDLNRERGLLIDKNIAGAITPSESRRLEELQEAADRHLDPMRPAFRVNTRGCDKRPTNRTGLALDRERRERERKPA